MNTYKNNFLTPLLFMCFLMIVSYSTPPKVISDNEKTVEIVETVSDVDENMFSEDILIQMMKDLNIKYPHIVLAQARLETGNYKSKIFNDNNNLFGMKEAKVRIHTATCTQHNHACYENWKESLYDYAFYQATYYSDVKNERQYFRKLDNSYAEAKNYSDKLKIIIERENLEGKFLDS